MISPRFDSAKVLTVGDAMIDRYWHGDAKRISAEAPIPVVEVKEIEDRLGGAANVALNVSTLGAESYLVAATGSDIAARELKDKLIALSSLCSLVSLAMAEKQPNDLIYYNSKEMIKKISSNDDDWIKEYINWELELLSEIGYGIDLSKCAVTSRRDELIYVSPTSGRAVTLEGAGSYKDRLIKLPKFIVSKDSECDNNDISNGLELTEYFLRKRFFEPNNLNFPQSRNRLKEIFNK